MNTPLSDNLRGAAFMMLSMAGFALNDGAMKSVLETQPLFPTLVLRGGVIVLIMLVVCHMTGALRWRPTPRDRRLIGRGRRWNSGLDATPERRRRLEPLGRPGRKLDVCAPPGLGGSRRMAKTRLQRVSRMQARYRNKQGQDEAEISL